MRTIRQALFGPWAAATSAGVFLAGWICVYLIIAGTNNLVGFAGLGIVCAALFGALQATLKARQRNARYLVRAESRADAGREH